MVGKMATLWVALLVLLVSAYLLDGSMQCNEKLRHLNTLLDREVLPRVV